MARKQTRRWNRPPVPRTLLKRLGARIRALRLERGLTQAELGAPYIGRSGVSQIESGSSSPSLSMLAALARRLGVEVRDLLPPGR